MLSLRRVVPRADLSRWDRSIRSAYDGRHHLIQYSDGTRELYDVLADPLEQRNLVGESPAVAMRLAGHLSEPVER